jgi:hypothetical protein
LVLLNWTPENTKTLEREQAKSADRFNTTVNKALLSFPSNYHNDTNATTDRLESSLPNGRSS